MDANQLNDKNISLIGIFMGLKRVESIIKKSHRR